MFDHNWEKDEFGWRLQVTHSVPNLCQPVKYADSKDKAVEMLCKEVTRWARTWRAMRPEDTPPNGMTHAEVHKFFASLVKYARSL